MLSFRFSQSFSKQSISWERFSQVNTKNELNYFCVNLREFLSFFTLFRKWLNKSKAQQLLVFFNVKKMIIYISSIHSIPKMTTRFLYKIDSKLLDVKIYSINLIDWSNQLINDNTFLMEFQGENVLSIILKESCNSISQY